MESARPKLAIAVWDAIPVTGRYEQDVLNDFLTRWSHHEITKALEWLCKHGHLRKCGGGVRPLYARPERRFHYTNVRPVTGVVGMLLTMHRNFITQPSTEKPQ